MTTKITMLLSLTCLVGAQACWPEEWAGMTPGQTGAAPDLTVRRFKFDRSPMQGQPLNVNVSVGNTGDAPLPAGVAVQWYARATDLFPACEWSVQALAVDEAVLLTCEYAGYPSAFQNLNTKVELDVYDLAYEGSPEGEANNTYLSPVTVF